MSKVNKFIVDTLVAAIGIAFLSCVLWFIVKVWVGIVELMR